MPWPPRDHGTLQLLSRRSVTSCYFTFPSLSFQYCRLCRLQPRAILLCAHSISMIPLVAIPYYLTCVSSTVTVMIGKPTSIHSHAFALRPLSAPLPATVANTMSRAQITICELRADRNPSFAIPAVPCARTSSNAALTLHSRCHGTETFGGRGSVEPAIFASLLDLDFPASYCETALL